MLYLVKTCESCPEQYDAYTKSGEQVGYLRLRHGVFRADYIEEDGSYTQVLSTEDVIGDGSFADIERDRMLSIACRAIMARMMELEIAFNIVSEPPEKK